MTKKKIEDMQIPEAKKFESKVDYLFSLCEMIADKVEELIDDRNESVEEVWKCKKCERTSCIDIGDCPFFQPTTPEKKCQDLTCNCPPFSHQKESEKKECEDCPRGSHFIDDGESEKRNNLVRIATEGDAIIVSFIKHTGRDLEKLPPTMKEATDIVFEMIKQRCKYCDFDYQDPTYCSVSGRTTDKHVWL